MPYYETHLTLPADTSQENAIERDVDLTEGVLSNITIIFPDGCAGLVHVQVLHREDQFVPRGLGQTLIGDDRQFDRPFHKKLTDSPFYVTVKGWNLDDTYPHTIIFGFLVEKSSENLVNLLRSVFRIGR